MCQAAILHWWAPNRQQALYTNSLLNYGNQQFAALAPSQSSHAGTGAGSAPADTFWLAAPVYDNLLAFNYPVSALPDGFQVGVQQPGHRRTDGQKRMQPDNGVLSHQHFKKSKSGSGKHTQRQHGDHKGSKAHMQLPELSAKLQQRLATLLMLVTADAGPGTEGVKQACLWCPLAGYCCPICTLVRQPCVAVAAAYMQYLARVTSQTTLWYSIMH